MLMNYANKVMDYEYSMFMSVMHVSVSKHLWDKHFTVLWANDYFYELIGYAQEEYTALFHNHVDEYYRDDPAAVLGMAEIIQSAYDRQEPGYEFECQMPTKSGKLVWIRVTGRFTDEVFEGLPVIYTTYMDITNLKEMQFQLEEALHMAEQANRAKSDFLSRMSHDIRTPMNAIVGMTEIASAHLDNTLKVQDCLKKITLSSQHLLSLINDVLDMSKIESGKMTANMGPLFLPELIGDIVTIVQPDVKERGQSFSVRLRHVQHEHYYSDALRLRQVFINILSNACKFTPCGGLIAMAVDEEPAAKAGMSMLNFTFTDTGIGIKPEFVEQIFDSFTREQDSRVDKTEGTGLGMAITKKIVDMLGGSIRVQSQIGKGTTFFVRIPMQLDESAQETVPQLPNVKVLVVDDEETACEYTVQVLEESGVRADWTTSGANALSRIEAAHKENADYDAVILDWKMPGLDGVHTAQMIRDKMDVSLPILMISAYDWADIEKEAQEAGVSGFLQKPLFRSVLIHNLRQHLLGQTPDGRKTEQKRHYDFTGKTFLLVEDNELNREIAQELLSPTGAVIELANDGAQGLDKFAQSPVGYYDLILMDVQMPVMNGYTATRQIRNLSRADAQTVPIVAMTADAFAEDMAAAREAGMNDHLAKPLDVNSMKQKISTFFH